MKKILLFLLLFINLHVVIQEAGIKIDMTATANAQRLIREVSAGLFECEDIETYERYFSSLSTCDAEAGDPDEFNCCWCGETFYTQDARAKHEETCPKKIKDKFQCQYCEEEFSTAKELSDHENNCGPCKCDYRDCGKRFKTETELEEHKRTHQGPDSGGSAGGGTGGGTGGGPAGGGATGGFTGSGAGGSTMPTIGKPRIHSSGLFCQTQYGDCAPTAMANAAMLAQGKSPQEAELLWRNIKKDYQTEKKMSFSTSGMSNIDIHAVMSSHGIISEDTETVGENNYERMASFLTPDYQVMGIMNPTGEASHKIPSHAVNIVGVNRDNNGIIKSFNVFDPESCDYITIPKGMFWAAIPVRNKK